MKKLFLCIVITSFCSQLLVSQVVSTDLNILITNSPNYSRTDLDLNNDGTVDFVIDFINQTGGAGIYLAGIGSDNNNEIVAPSFWNVIPHNEGEEIGPVTTGWYNPTGSEDPDGNFTQYSRLAYKFYGGGNTSGMWVNLNNKFVGLKFFANGNTYYGYLELSCKVDPQPGFLSIVKMAYQSTPNTAILTGEISMPFMYDCDADNLTINTIDQDENRAKFTITSDVFLDQTNPVVFAAGDEIELTSPFEVSLGATFSAEIEGCQ